MLHGIFIALHHLGMSDLVMLTDVWVGCLCWKCIYVSYCFHCMIYFDVSVLGVVAFAVPISVGTAMPFLRAVCQCCRICLLYAVH